MNDTEGWKDGENFMFFKAVVTRGKKKNIYSCDFFSHF